MSTFREYVMVPADEMSRLTDEYKGRLTENMRLTKAARLAAEKHLLLDSNMPSGLKEARVKQVSRPLNRLIKKIRGGPPVAAPLPEGEEEDDETDAMVEGPTATLVRSLLKKAHRKKGATITSGNAAETPHRPALPPKPKCVRLQVPSLSLEEQREAPLPFAEVLGSSPGSTSKEKADIIVNKLKRQQRKKAATEVERLKSLQGWEAFDQGRQTRRKLDGKDY